MDAIFVTASLPTSAKATAALIKEIGDIDPI